MRDQGKSSEEVKISMGTPNIHAFAALIKVMLASKDIDPIVKEKVEKTIKMWAEQQTTNKIIAEHIPHLKMSKMY
eukprot:10748290-Karenia_brevis.AAC.1